MTPPGRMSSMAVGTMRGSGRGRRTAGSWTPPRRPVSAKPERPVAVSPRSISPIRCRRAAEIIAPPAPTSLPARPTSSPAEHSPQQRLRRALAGDRPAAGEIGALLLRRAQHREPDARTAPPLARAVFDQPQRRAQELAHDRIATLGVAQATRVAVVH